ncbi:MAG: DUF1254 domain-containing protein [Solirubrobacteraceae bacterium]
MRFLSFKWIFITLLLAVFFHLAALFAIPRVIFTLLKYKTEKQAGGKNKILFNELAQAGKDKIVRTSPDILYAAISYDVSKNPIKVSFHQTNKNNYWSASLFEGKTGANIFTLNDSTVKNSTKSNVFSLVIKKQGSVYKENEDEKTVGVKLDNGVLLYRMVLPNRENKAQVDSLINIQKRTTVKEIL